MSTAVTVAFNTLENLDNHLKVWDFFVSTKDAAEAESIFPAAGRPASGPSGGRSQAGRAGSRGRGKQGKVVGVQHVKEVATVAKLVGGGHYPVAQRGDGAG